MNDLARAIDIITALTRSCPDHFTSWGSYSPELVRRLENFWAHSLPADVLALCSRWPNLQLAYTSLPILGPLKNKPAAQAITEEERTYWHVPADELVIARENTDIVLLHASGSIITRDGSTPDRVVFERHASIAPFLFARLRQHLAILREFHEVASSDMALLP
jgi:hypothetical protein